MSEASLPWALAAGAAGVVGAMGATALIAKRSGKAAYVDAAWGASFVAATWAAVLAGLVEGYHGTWRSWLIVALVTVWGARLTWHLGRRIVGSDHDDPRYETYLGGPLRSVPFTRVVLKVFVLQAVLVVIVSWPVIVGIARPVTAPWLVALGAFLWLGGACVEAIADAQLAAFRADPDRPRLLTTGLWSWSRHPNYFGDFCLWWGLWLVGGAASGFADAGLTVVAPVLMSWILIGVSGVRLAETRMQGREGWAAYCVRTSIFIPWPPTRRSPIQ